MLEISPQTLTLPAKREADSHKGVYGRGLMIGGSRGMAGAIAISGMAALRSGAGLVTLAAPEGCVETVASFHPAIMTSALPCDISGSVTSSADDNIRDLSENATCVAIGPGLGLSNQIAALVSRFYRESNKPMVVDADALNALAREPDSLVAPGGPRVLTPHPGEFGRLAEGLELAPDGPGNQAEAMARRCNAVVILKGNRSLVTDGKTTMRNTTGNPGMATAGAGDVLTGVITALICQGLAPFEAATLGVYVHGMAGDLAAEKRGQIGMIATDIIEFLPAAFQKLGHA